MLDRVSVNILQKMKREVEFDIDKITEKIQDQHVTQAALNHLTALGYLTASDINDKYTVYRITIAGRAAIEKHKRQQLFFWLPVGISLLALFRPELVKLLDAIKQLLA